MHEAQGAPDHQLLPPDRALGDDQLDLLLHPSRHCAGANGAAGHHLPDDHQPLGVLAGGGSQSQGPDRTGHMAPDQHDLRDHGLVRVRPALEKQIRTIST